MRFGVDPIARLSGHIEYTRFDERLSVSSVEQDFIESEILLHNRDQNRNERC